MRIKVFLLLFLSLLVIGCGDDGDSIYVTDPNSPKTADDKIVIPTSCDYKTVTKIACTYRRVNGDGTYASPISQSNWIYKYALAGAQQCYDYETILTLYGLAMDSINKGFDANSVAAWFIVEMKDATGFDPLYECPGGCDA